MVCAWICCDNNSCTCNGKTYHQKLKSEVKMFGLIMTLTAKVAVEMFAKGAGTAIHFSTQEQSWGKENDWNILIIS